MHACFACILSDDAKVGDPYLRRSSSQGNRTALACSGGNSPPDISRDMRCDRRYPDLIKEGEPGPVQQQAQHGHSLLLTLAEHVRELQLGIQAPQSLC